MASALDSRRRLGRLARFAMTSTLARYGLELRRVPKAYASTAVKTLDPVTCEYIPALRGRAVIEMQLSDARAFHVLGLKYDPVSHPFVRASIAGLSATEGDVERCIFKNLADYYTGFGPCTAAEVAGLDTLDAPGLAAVHASGWILPWSARSVAQTIVGRETALQQVAFEHGQKLTMSDGLTAFGPVSERKLALETSRLAKLIASVKVKGFQPYSQKSPLKVTGLRSAKTYRWLVEEGQHRLAVAAALGITDVPTMVVEVVRREDAAFWPQVVNGVFKPEGAVTLFDRIWDGKPPSGLWWEKA